ncbi:hypothetical protein SNE35_00615 [Paucibacter sp. R3-3]|uniref:Aminopeptidase n=1 Tax=Roseateles agri TaxID=3098619 RepID=A0ABU5DAX5_9BURK|nr:hypothetical protein [Paucibacter sp. R3-3]MDY0742981.1 hypothetical protein [Paucibacter sp. R3-3]
MNRTTGTRSLGTLLLGLMLVLGGCATRSISNAGCDSSRSYGCEANAPAELSEFDVLGIARDARPNDADIAAALARPRVLRLDHASRLLLIQSGSAFPDAPMRDALAARYTVGSFSGMRPWQAKGSTADVVDAVSYARSMRLAAAQGGFDKVLVYWGVLESARKNNVASNVSWVPVIGWVLPDEREHMRIRLRLALIDVASGQWEMLEPPPVADDALSSVLSRRDVDQTLVAQLKDRGYATAVESLRQRFER